MGPIPKITFLFGSLKMGVWSTLHLSALSGGIRLDPEYYQPRYVHDLARLNQFECWPIAKIATVTDGIHSSPDVVDEDGVRYLSAKSVRQFDFSVGDSLRISQKQHDSNPRTSLREGDVLLTTVGTIGNAAVVQNDLLPANADRHLGIIRVTDRRVDPYFLASFLNCEFGRFQSLREATGNVQLNLFVEKVKSLLVPSLRCADRVSASARKGYAYRAEARASVARAERLVLKVLGSSNASFAPQLTYSATLSGMIAAKRLGAEYFMPAKKIALDLLSTKGAAPLSDYVDSVRDVWNPARVGGSVRNFDLSHATEPFLDSRVTPSDASSIGSSKKRLLPGDIVISRLRSYLKQIAVVQTANDYQAVGSSEFIVLRSRGELSPEALLAFLRSDAIQTVLKWSQDGTNHPRFDETTLLNVPVPKRFLNSQNAVADEVKFAIKQRQAMIGEFQRCIGLIEYEIGKR